ncbi:MAG TPA: hypothetical protein VH352_24170 [Pseudonocardiaceae bacterium]|nr:hypothetical protein [Pseudonocardiaceae bacterium]
MSEPTDPTPAVPRPGPRRPPSIAEVFGDVLPDLTSDERTPEASDPAADTWYQDNRPPHHDRG